MRKFVCSILAAATVFAHAGDNILKNPGFSEVSPGGVPSGWEMPDRSGSNSPPKLPMSPRTPSV